MTATAPADAIGALLQQFGEGRKAALARAVSIVENRRPGADRLLAELHPRLGRARRIGVTGPPGAGKSTLTTELTAAYRRAGLTVGVVAVDPTSPFTGGALLGDRIRMEAVALDPGVFIRSMATRGSLGGLAAATRDVTDVLDAFGLDRVIVETVGVGQTELDVSRTTDTTMVVLVPESGDSIQTLKAGLMEIADIFVVNKSDRPGADRLRNELELMIGLRSGDTLKNMPAHHGVDLGRAMTKAEKLALNPARAAREAARAESERWTPPVLRTVAAKAEGVGDVVASLDRHAHYLETSGTLAERRRRRLRDRVVEIVERTLQQRLWRHPGTSEWLLQQIPALEAGATNPLAVALDLIARSGDLMTGQTR
jgi:LAO/AO transport system kinase